MKTLSVALLLVVIALGCNGQVQVPSANVQPVIDSLNVLKARVATLEGLAVEVKTGTATFAGTAFRRAVYVQGLTSAWRVGVWPVYNSDTPAIDFVVRKEIKPDSLIVLRQTNGTQNLTVEYIAILP